MSSPSPVVASPEQALQRELGLRFRDPFLLRLALTHRSYVHERPQEGQETNERLEFLGDAFLGMVVAEELYCRFPGTDEGKLTSLRSRVVRSETLARIARDLRLGDYLYLGRGEERSGGRRRERNQARALEALLGALLMDQGFAEAKRWTLSIFGTALQELSPAGEKEYKSVLQEAVQARGESAPRYRTKSSEGPGHSKDFVVEVLVGERVLGQGQGKSKRTAEREAARDALGRLPVEEESRAG